MLSLFDTLPNFPFAISKTKCDYGNKHGIHELPHKLPNNLRLRVLGN